ncbi:peptidoglycan editing factor PgeF [Clostridium ganghwense]|uniref:Purine nucleoside phosphorylase n=1 Tax=Clostridium ganghwense TaxID=312089 RepID=A0ABT4CTG9_9CLOT|nr:peptidoglycan editing factor PgeF [Clostridium ganghwense]MCY6372337.1 peptidoglycan editing factor PgeF [Clostridium ganghwense]
MNTYIDNFQLLKFLEEDAEIYFSTSKENLNFNKNTEEGIENISKLKSWFGLKEVGYLNQVHSNLVYTYDSKVHDGDAIITDLKGVAIGVFTADCVPVIVYDKKKKVAAAVHSGWRGTIENISIETINKMIKEYNTAIEDLVVYIGPHNMQCCYEVSEELVSKFKNLELYKNRDIAEGRNLSLQKCIIGQLNSIGIRDNQINTLDICTFCSTKHRLYSYRKQKEESGRMFSFIFIK